MQYEALPICHIGTAPDSSSSDDYDFLEDSVDEYVDQRFSKSRETWCTPLDFQVQQNVNNGKLTSQSWASEMSLYDKMSPRKPIESIKIPRTPVAIPSPTEIEGFNWKTMNHVLENINSISNSLTHGHGMANEQIDAAIIKELQEEKGEKVGARRSFSCGPGDELPMEIPERVISDLSKEHSSVKFDQSSTGPAFDYKNLLVNYLPPDMDSTVLRNLFMPFGTIVRSKVVVDRASGLSKGYGFVKFKSEEDGIKAQEALNQFHIGRKTLKVSFSRRVQNGENSKHNTNLYISNLDLRINEETLERHFKTCGYVVQCKVLKNAHGISKQIAFVRYDKAESAQRAIDRFNGQLLEGTNRPIKIRIAGTPRLAPRKNAFGGYTFGSSASSPNSPPLVNSTSSACYVTGFHVSLSENVLRNVFEPIGGGKVKSIRIIRRQKSPYAFVNFFASEDAAEAAYMFNNYNLEDCTLTVRLQT